MTLTLLGIAVEDRCKQCNQRLVEIDNYGERLIGCIECNCWRSLASKRPIEFMDPSCTPRRMIDCCCELRLDEL
jgi:hypothetical protein